MIIIININWDDLSNLFEDSWWLNNMKREYRPLNDGNSEEILDPQETLLLEGYSLWFDESFTNLSDKDKEIFINKKISQTKDKEEEKSLYITLTELFYHTKQFKKINKISDYIIETYKEDLLYTSVFHYYKGVSCIEVENFEEAVENLLIADQLNPNQHEYIRQLGYAYFCLGEQFDSDEFIDKWILLLKRALNMTPEDLQEDIEQDLQFCFEYEKEKGLSHLKNEDYKSALNSFQRISELKVKNLNKEEINSYLWYTKYMNGNKNEWLKMLKENFNKSSVNLKFKKNMIKLLKQ